MTMKPKAPKFRTPRGDRVASRDSMPFASTDDGFGDQAFPGSAKAEVNDDAIAEIRREGLTGRQLRMARRLAQKNGLSPSSDFDAVRLLRARGIDPFDRANMLEVVTARPAACGGSIPLIGQICLKWSPHALRRRNVRQVRSLLCRKNPVHGARPSPRANRRPDVRPKRRVLCATCRKRLSRTPNFLGHLPRTLVSNRTSWNESSGTSCAAADRSLCFWPPA